MHEASIALNLIEAVEERLETVPGSRVASIRVRIGELSGVSSDATRLPQMCSGIAPRLAM